jgi:ADP-heptose:LPS heptosyltransferase
MENFRGATKVNILFINTLRLGDTLMSWHVVRSIQKQHPSAVIDYLAFDNSKVLKPLLQHEVNFHFISRSLLQEMNSDVDVSLFRAYDELEKELKPVLAKKYDLLVNFSNTKISTYLASMMTATEYIGTHFNTQKAVNYGSKWVEYLDVKSTSLQGGYFHFNEIFSNALGLPIAENSELKETNTGLVEVKKYIQSDRKKYVMQLFTSDKKKDFPEHKLSSFLIELNKHLDGDFLLLCMPGTEHSQPKLAVDNAHWVACSLEGAYSLLKASDALISVDTSIKHLAAFTDAKIVELSFGSSMPQQTGAYKSSGLVIQSKEYCYPCKHSSTCSREAIFCSNKINEIELADTIGSFLNNQTLRAADSFDHSVTYMDGFHYVLQSPDSVRVREYILAKLSWVYHLSQTLSEQAHELVHFFIEEISGLSFERLDQNLIFLQRELEDVFRNLKVGDNIKTFTEDQRFLNLQGILKNLNLDFKIPQQEGKIDFVQTRFMQNQLQELLNYLSSYRKLSQDILSEAKYYERANGKNVTL